MKRLTWRRLGRQRWVQVAAGTLAAVFVRLVLRTNRMTLHPPDIYEQVDSHFPIIIAMWHGQHFLLPFLKRPQDRAKVLISRHRDGELNAIAAERFGIEAIRGSGDHGDGFNRKGGVSAFVEMLKALEAGYSMALTADVPTVSRVAGLGIVKLAQKSGRSIYPLALATSRRVVLGNWDRTTISLPFGRGVAVAGQPISVAHDADAAALEAARVRVQAELEAVTARAYALVDGDRGAAA